MAENRSLMETAAHLNLTLQCNCDLDNWGPEQSTGHSWVCRIHKAAMAQHYAGRNGSAAAWPREAKQ